jgi:nitroreductase
MTDFFEVLHQRRSVRHFTDEEVPRATIEMLLGDAAWAPSGGNDQPWAVTAITPAKGIDFRARFERSGWDALLPKLRMLFQERAEDMVESNGIVRGRPWHLLIHEAHTPVPRDRISPALPLLELVNGPLDHDVARLSVAGFVATFCLAAHARGLGATIQSSYVAFEPALWEEDWLGHPGALVTTIVIGFPVDEPRTSRRRPVPCVFV